MLPRPDHRGRWPIAPKRAMPLYCALGLFWRSDCAVADYFDLIDGANIVIYTKTPARRPLKSLNWVDRYLQFTRAKPRDPFA